MFDFLNIVPNNPGSGGAIGWWGDPEKAKASLGYDTNKPLTKEQRLELEVIKMNKTEVDTTGIAKSASYEENNGTTVVVGSSSGSGNGNNQSTESTGSFTIDTSNGSGDSTLSDLQYKNSG